MLRKILREIKRWLRGGKDIPAWRINSLRREAVKNDQ